MIARKLFNGVAAKHVRYQVRGNENWIRSTALGGNIPKRSLFGFSKNDKTDNEGTGDAELKSKQKSKFDELLSKLSEDEAHRKREEEEGKYIHRSLIEITELDETGGKLFEAPAEMKDVKDSVPFPLIKALPLNSTDLDDFVHVDEFVKGRVSLVIVFFRKIGRDHIDTWKKPFDDHISSLRNQQRQQGLARSNTSQGGYTKKSLAAQSVTITCAEDWYWKYFKGTMMGQFKQLYPEASWPTTFAHFGEMNRARLLLNMRNSYAGYVHLVDKEGRVRWTGVGEATQSELQTLLRLTDELVSK